MFSCHNLATILFVSSTNCVEKNVTPSRLIIAPSAGSWMKYTCAAHWVNKSALIGHYLFFT